MLGSCGTELQRCRHDSQMSGQSCLPDSNIDLPNPRCSSYGATLMLNNINFGSKRRLKEERELLHKSRLINSVWYRKYYPDFNDTPIDCAQHYLQHGAA